MSIPGNTRLLIIGGGIAAVLIVGWFMVSSIADSRAEQAIDDFLSEHGLRDDVRWKSLSASPFGSVRLDDVTVARAGVGELRIARVDIADFVDERRRKRADIRLTGIATPDGLSPLGTIEPVRAGGRADLPPASLQIDWDLDLDDDVLAMRMSVMQPQAMEATLELELERVAALAQLAELAQTGRPAPGAMSEALDPLAALGRYGGRSPAARPPIGGDLFAQGLGAVLGMLETVGEVRVRYAGLVLRDDGYVKRSVALHKRYAIPVSAGEGSVDGQREQAFKRAIDEARSGCEKDLPLGSASKRRSACAAILDFVSAEESTLSLRLRPERPFSLSGLMQAGMGDPARVVPMLNPDFGS